MTFTINSSTLSNYKDQIHKADTNGDGILSQNEIEKIDYELRNLLTGGVSISEAESKLSASTKQQGAQLKTQQAKKPEQKQVQSEQEQGSTLNLVG